MNYSPPTKGDTPVENQISEDHLGYAYIDK